MSLVLKALRHRPAEDAPALVDDAGCLAAGELVDATARVTAALRENGSRAVGISLPNSTGWVTADLATVAAGAACVPVPAFFSDEQRLGLVTRSGLDTWIGDDPPPGAVRLAFPQLPIWRLAASRHPIPDRVAKVTFTSGTTGTPKGVLLEQALLERVAGHLARLARRRGIRRHLCCLPLAVLLENVAGVLAPLMAGGTVMLPRHTGLSSDLSAFDPAQLAACIDRLAAESLILLPQMLVALTTWAEACGWRGASLRLVAVGGAPIAPGWLHRARRVGLPVHQGYGMSECGSVITFDDSGAGTDHCGTPIAGRRARISPQGEIEVWNGGFRGYLDGPSQDPVAWWPTGDRGCIDAHGRLQILGRLDNLIVTPMGRNISPEWIEARLADGTGLSQAVVLGPDLRALIHAPPALSDDQIRDRILAVNRTLPAYAAVTAWLRLPLPLARLPGALTANGRPRRRHLADRYPPDLFQSIHYPTLETA